MGAYVESFFITVKTYNYADIFNQFFEEVLLKLILPNNRVYSEDLVSIFYSDIDDNKTKTTVEESIKNNTIMIYPPITLTKKARH